LKKQSAANSVSPKLLEDLTFFLDRQLGRHKMAGILRATGLKVEIHDDHFAQDAPDTEWLAEDLLQFRRRSHPAAAGLRCLRGFRL
jgi:hypothetical protein